MAFLLLRIEERRERASAGRRGERNKGAEEGGGRRTEENKGSKGRGRVARVFFFFFSRWTLSFSSSVAGLSFEQNKTPLSHDQHLFASRRLGTIRKRAIESRSSEGQQKVSERVKKKKKTSRSVSRPRRLFGLFPCAFSLPSETNAPAAQRRAPPRFSSKKRKKIKFGWGPRRELNTGPPLNSILLETFPFSFKHPKEESYH